LRFFYFIASSYHLDIEQVTKWLGGVTVWHRTLDQTVMSLVPAAMFLCYQAV